MRETIERSRRKRQLTEEDLEIELNRISKQMAQNEERGRRKKSERKRNKKFRPKEREHNSRIDDDGYDYEGDGY